MFIVLEGSDGSGKTTQFKLLAERLRAAGHEVDSYDFPRYDEPSSYFVRRYLNGEYGPASEVSPYTASLFYALDRYEAAPLIRQSLAKGRIVLANRYAGSNMAHQGAKFSKSGEQRGFFMWAESLEFQLLSIPRPSINLFLRVPADIAHKLINKKAPRGYTSRSHDEHEADVDHLRRSVAAYDSLCQLFPKDFKAIDSTQGSKILPITEINNRLWEILKPLLPKPSRPGRSAVINLSDKSQRVSRRQDKELARSSDAVNSLSEGLELKDVSLLALNALQAHGLDVDYELKWPPKLKPRITYYIPAELPPKLSEKYRSTMDRLASIGRKLEKTLPDSTGKSLAYIIPMAALVNGTAGGNLELAGRIVNAQEQKLAELRQITKLTGDKPKEPQALKQIIRQMTGARLAGNSGAPDHRVRLLSASPRNELELLADCLYPYSNLSREEISAEIDGWTYEKKAEALKALSVSDQEALLKRIRYQLDVIDDAVTLKELIKLLKPLDFQTQPLTPRYGYQVPAEIEAAGADESFIECFDLSLEIYSDIQAAGLEYLAGYAVLLGHKQRWQFSIDGQAIFNPRHERASITEILDLIKEQVREVHPLIAGSIKEAASIKSPAPAQKPTKHKDSTGKSRRKKRGTKSKK